MGMSMHVNPRAALRAGVVLLAAGLLAGCASDRRDLESWVADVRARPAPPLEPLPVMQQFETFEYNAQGMRDPFAEPIVDRAGGGNGPRPDPERRRELLESVPLDSLDMVGTIGGETNMTALLMGPDRVVHRVGVGNYIGQSDGRVTRVLPDRIELVELVPDGAGGWLERQAAVALEDK